MVDVLCHIWVYWFNGDRATDGAQWVAIADEQLDTPKLDWLVGFFAFQTGDFEKAVARFMGAIERFEKTEDAEWKAMSQGFAGALFEDLDAGREMLEAALAQFGEDDFGVNGYLAKLFLSINYMARGDSETALRLREESLAWVKAVDYMVLIAWAEWHVAAALLVFGRVDEAEDHTRRVLTQMVGDGYQEGIAGAVDLFAGIAFHRGETERALNLVGGADAVFEALGAYRWPEQTSAVEAVLTGAREQLGDAECDRLLSEGNALNLEALIDLASAP